MERLDVLEECRAVLGAAEGRDELPREGRELVCERVPEERELLRGVPLLRSALARRHNYAVHGLLRMCELSCAGVW